MMQCEMQRKGWVAHHAFIDGSPMSSAIFICMPIFLPSDVTHLYLVRSTSTRLLEYYVVPGVVPGSRNSIRHHVPVQLSNLRKYESIHFSSFLGVRYTPKCILYSSTFVKYPKVLFSYIYSTVLELCRCDHRFRYFYKGIHFGVYLCQWT